MSRTALFLLFLVCCFAPQAAAQVQFQDISLEAALERARTEDKLVLVFFSSKQCNKSALLKNKFFPDPANADSIEAAFVSIQLDADVLETRAYYDKYDLWGLGDPTGTILPAPRMLFLDSAGKKIGDAQGVPADRVEEAADGDFVFGNLAYKFKPESMLRKIMLQVEKENPNE